MRLGLFLVFSLMLLGLGCGGTSNYMLPVDSPAYPFRAPATEDFDVDSTPASTDTAPAPTFDPDLLDEEVGDDDDDADTTGDQGEAPAGDQGGAAKPTK